MGLLSLGASAFGLGKSIGSALFGGGGNDGPTQVMPDKMVQWTAKGARRGSKQYGFNPLTLLGAGGAGAVVGGGSGPPPLASIDAIKGFADDIDYHLSGQRERDEAAQRTNQELAEIKLEQARAQLENLRNPAVLGGRSITRPVPTGRTFTEPLSMGQRSGAAAAARDGTSDRWLTEGREVEQMSVPNTAGVMELENAATGGVVQLPGDSEPWGVDELLTGLVVGGPQAVRNHGRNIIDEVTESQDDTDEEAKERRKHAYDGLPASFRFPGVLGVLSDSMNIWR